MAKVKRKSPIKQNWEAWVWIKWKAGCPEDAWKTWWKKRKEIKAAWSTMGEWDCSLWIDVDNPDKLEDLVWNTIRDNQWVDKTETHWVKKLSQKR